MDKNSIIGPLIAIIPGLLFMIFSKRLAKWGMKNYKKVSTEPFLKKRYRNFALFFIVLGIFVSFISIFLGVITIVLGVLLIIFGNSIGKMLVRIYGGLANERYLQILCFIFGLLFVIFGLIALFFGENLQSIR